MKTKTTPTSRPGLCKERGMDETSGCGRINIRSRLSRESPVKEEIDAIIRGRPGGRPVSR